MYAISILVIYWKHQNVNQSVYNCSEKILYLLKFIRFQRVGTPIINEWTGVVVLCCYEKSSSYIPPSKLIRSCSYGQISHRTSNVFKSSISNEM